jgi:hypothetical protein
MGLGENRRKETVADCIKNLSGDRQPTGFGRSAAGRSRNFQIEQGVGE